MLNLLDTAEEYAVQGEFEKACSIFSNGEAKGYFRINSIVDESEVKNLFYLPPSVYFDYSGSGSEDKVEEILAPLDERASSISKERFEGYADQKLKTVALELQSNFPRFYSFLQEKGISFMNLSVIKKGVYYSSYVKKIKSIGKKDIPSLVDKIKTQMGDFDFHDAMEVLEKDCYENLSKTDADKLYRWNFHDCIVTPNYDTRLYDFVYYDYNDVPDMVVPIYLDSTMD